MRILGDTMRTRSCGECQMCCTEVAVKPLNKPMGQRCQFQCGTGCAIYKDRPSPCAQYNCSWMDGHLPIKARPDNCGMLFETTWIEEPRELHIVFGWELVPGAWDKLLPQLDLRKGWVFAHLDEKQGDCAVAYDNDADLKLFMAAMASMANGGLQYQQKGLMTK